MNVETLAALGIEGYCAGAIAMSWTNIETAIAQIDGGKLPHYDDNARQAISEELVQIRAALLQRREMTARSNAGDRLPITIPGLTLDYLHATDTLDTVASFLPFIAITLMLRPVQAPSECACWRCRDERADAYRTVPAV